MILLLLPLAMASSRLAHDEAHTGTRAIPVALAPSVEDAARVSPEMRAWLQANVPRYGTEDERMRQLLAALSQKRDLVYDNRYTGTAEEVFASGQFNCLALAHLIVGMGRELGVDAYYVRVEEIRTWHRGEELLLTSTHVAAAWGPSTAMQLVDIEPVTERERKMADRISDTEALALHHSNRGAESLVANRPDLALAWLDRAAEIDANVPEVWINRGVALRKLGSVTDAIASYEQALAIDPGSSSAWRNLAAARVSLGEEDALRGLLAAMERRGDKSPYTWLTLGDTALQIGDLSTARRLYRHARSLSWGNPSVLYALERLATAQGDLARAERLRKRNARREERGTMGDAPTSG